MKSVIDYVFRAPTEISLAMAHLLTRAGLGIHDEDPVTVEATKTLEEALPSLEDQDKQAVETVLHRRFLEENVEELWKQKVKLHDKKVLAMYVLSSRRLRSNGWISDIPERISFYSLTKRESYNSKTYYQLDWLGCDELINDGYEYDGQEPFIAKTSDMDDQPVPRAFRRGGEVDLTDMDAHFAVKTYFFKGDHYDYLNLLFEQLSVPEQTKRRYYDNINVPRIKESDQIWKDVFEVGQTPLLRDCRIAVSEDRVVDETTGKTLLEKHNGKWSIRFVPTTYPELKWVKTLRTIVDTSRFNFSSIWMNEFTAERNVDPVDYLKHQVSIDGQKDDGIEVSAIADAVTGPDAMMYDEGEFRRYRGKLPESIQRGKRMVDEAKNLQWTLERRTDVVKIWESGQDDLLALVVANNDDDFLLLKLGDKMLLAGEDCAHVTYAINGTLLSNSNGNGTGFVYDLWEIDNPSEILKTIDFRKFFDDLLSS